MWQMLVHWDYTPNAWFACYRWEYFVLELFVQLHVFWFVQIFLIVIVNMEYHIVIFIVRDSVFQLWIISAEFVSSCFCWVQLQFVSLLKYNSRWVWLDHSQFSNCLLAILVQIFDWYSVLETCTGTWTFDWELFFIFISFPV